MNAIQTFLWPLTVPYGAWVQARSWAYGKRIFQSRRLAAMVISVGNLTTGGTGKTPMVCWIAERLFAEGKRVGVLTRGYRGRDMPSEKGPQQAAGVEFTSDEVELLKTRLGDRVPIGVGGDRFAKGQELAQQGIDWFVLDDGFQHLRLARDVDIVLLDATNPFAGGLLPAGRLREPKSALARADIVVVTRSSYAPALEAAIRRETAAPIFYANTALDSIHPAGDVLRAADATKVRSQKLFAFCGIGNPAAFFADLRRWELQIVGDMSFRDHHCYTQEDVREIEHQARKTGADALICTEKDLFNLKEVHRQNFELLFCRIALRIDREDSFWSTVMARADSSKRSPVLAG